MNNDSASPSRRQYSSTLREEQAEQTRERILAAVAELLGVGEIDELSFATVAKQAGVSVPTVYRYFPSRKDLFDGIQEWLNRELKAPPFPQSVEELKGGSPELYAYYDRARDLFRAALVSSLFREAHQTSRRDRDKRLSKLLEPATEHLEPREANAIHALVRLLFGFEGFSFMNERFGVTADEAASVVSLTMRSLLTQIDADARRNNKSLTSHKPRSSKQRPRPTTKGDRGR